MRYTMLQALNNPGKTYIVIICGDLHCHTTYSDGSLSPGERVVKTINNGLDFLAVTDHFTLEGATKAQEFVARFKLPLIIVPGVEFSVENRHVLALGIKENPYEDRRMLPLSEVRGLVTQQKGVLVAAHPAWPHSRYSWETGLFHEQHLDQEMFDAVEIINCVEDHDETVSYYRKHGHFPITAGSDSHGWTTRDRAVNWVRVDQAQPANIVECIREGEVAVQVKAGLRGRQKRALKRGFWLGLFDVCADMRSVAKQRKGMLNTNGISVECYPAHTFPENVCTVTLISSQDTAVRMRSNAYHINRRINLSAGEPYLIEFPIPETKTGEYIYWLIEDMNTGYLAVANTFVVPPVRACFYGLTGRFALETTNQSAHPVKATLKLGKEKQELLLSENSSITRAIPHEARSMSWKSEGVDQYRQDIPRSFLPIAPFRSFTRIELKEFKLKPTPFLEVPKGFLSKTKVNYGMAWTEDYLYLRFDVKTPAFCQPFDYEDLDRGDSILFGLRPATIGCFAPRGSHGQRQRMGEEVIFRMALLSSGPIITSVGYAGFGTEKKHIIRISRDEEKQVTNYEARLRWDFLMQTGIEPGACFFCNMQVHLHDGDQYLGYVCPRASIDIGFPTESWPIAQIVD